MMNNLPAFFWEGLVIDKDSSPRLKIIYNIAIKCILRVERIFYYSFEYLN